MLSPAQALERAIRTRVDLMLSIEEAESVIQGLEQYGYLLVGKSTRNFHTQPAKKEEQD